MHYWNICLHWISILKYVSHKGGAIDSSSHASVIPFIIKQICPAKGCHLCNQQNHFGHKCILYFVFVVKWKASQPLGFGKTARLSCCTNDKNLLEKTWKFTGGPDNTILAFDNTSSQSSKYGIQRQKNGFALLIYNLTQSDTNHLYTCSFGHYNSLSKTLAANDDHDDNTFGRFI